VTCQHRQGRVIAAPGGLPDIPGNSLIASYRSRTCAAPCSGVSSASLLMGNTRGPGRIGRRFASSDRYLARQARRRSLCPALIVLQNLDRLSSRRRLASTSAFEYLATNRFRGFGGSDQIEGGNVNCQIQKLFEFATIILGKLAVGMDVKTWLNVSALQRSAQRAGWHDC
jgi:hypothetical protein